MGGGVEPVQAQEAVLFFVASFLLCWNVPRYVTPLQNTKHVPAAVSLLLLASSLALALAVSFTSLSFVDVARFGGDGGEGKRQFIAFYALLLIYLYACSALNTAVHVIAWRTSLQSAQLGGRLRVQIDRTHALALAVAECVCSLVIGLVIVSLQISQATLRPASTAATAYTGTSVPLLLLSAVLHAAAIFTFVHLTA